MTVDEAKALAEEFEYDTDPNDEGEIEKRPGKLSDYLQGPYKNDEAARAANNGALPPDLSLMVKARHGGCNYIFSLLTGYPEENPAGVQIADGLNFNPYFPGGGIAMARVLYDGLVEYEDKTPATTSQMAKDVVEFLNWTAEPEMDERKKMGWKVLSVLSVLFAMSVWVKRYDISWPHTLYESLTGSKGTSGLRSRRARSCTIRQSPRRRCIPQRLGHRARSATRAPSRLAAEGKMALASVRWSGHGVVACTMDIYEAVDMNCLECVSFVCSIKKSNPNVPCAISNALTVSSSGEFCVSIL